MHGNHIIGSEREGASLDTLTDMQTERWHVEKALENGEQKQNEGERMVPWTFVLVRVARREYWCTPKDTEAVR